MAFDRIAVVGAGAWGTALANVIARAGRPGAALLAWLTRQDLSPAPGTSAYITGEAWLCAALHAHLVRERGFRPNAVRAMPYWKQRYAATHPS